MTEAGCSGTLAEKARDMGTMRTEERPEGRNVSARRYVDILSDAGFKAVFGDQRNKDVLLDLLNVVLPPHRKVDDISYSTTELPGLTLSNKNVRLDLRCTGRDGTVFIVEVQCYRQENLFSRCVGYAARVYDSGTERGDGQRYDIPPVYFICLLGDGAEGFDREGPMWEDRFISEYTFREKTSNDVPAETIFCIFVELNRFRKDLQECGSEEDRWCYALKRVGTLDGLPDGLREDAFERLFRACEIARFDRERRLTYENDMITERDYWNIIDTAARQGRAEGLAEGKAEGLAEGRIKIARALKEQGIAAETISAATGLSIEEVEAL